ncbi:hypothetical protein [Bdellovibrio sp.]|uniref:hypothetical protein n=1 Tax=Bdellovibrio sp. TaxID=28201 RepID=UPI0039E607B0
MFVVTNKKKVMFKVLMIPLFLFGDISMSIAAPTWRKVTISNSGGGGSTPSGGFNCVSVIGTQKVIPAAAAVALHGVQITYSMVGGGSGGHPSYPGVTGAIVAGSFTVDGSKEYGFYVGGGGGGTGPNTAAGVGGGNGGASTITVGGSNLVVAAGGVAFPAVGGAGSGGSGRSKGSCTASYGGDNGSNSKGGGGGGCGSGGNGGGTASWGVVSANDGQDGAAGPGGKGAVNWLTQTLPILPGLAGLGGTYMGGGNAGAIVLSYVGPSCLF